MPKIDRFHHVSSSNKEHILKFETYNRIYQGSEKTIGSYSKVLCKYARHLGNRSFEDVIEQDILKYAIDYLVEKNRGGSNSAPDP